MAKPLSDRIASARSTDRITVTDLGNLIAEATTERDRLSADAIQASQDSVNFALSEDARDKAANDADRYSRTAKALAIEIDALTLKIEASREREGFKLAKAERASIIAERDQLAHRLADEWPEIERKAIELLSAIKANDARMRTARIFEPSAEAIARDCDGMFMDGARRVRRLTEISLPAFAEGWNLAWPVQARAAQWAVDAGEIRKSQLVAEANRARQERERWRRHSVAPGPRCQFYTAFRAKASRDGYAQDACIQYDPPMLNPPPAYYFITDETASHLKKYGCQVELAEVENA